jgi:ABC-type maltose transport system permease subunit
MNLTAVLIIIFYFAIIIVPLVVVVRASLREISRLATAVPDTQQRKKARMT